MRASRVFLPLLLVFFLACNIKKVALIATAETTADFAAEAQKYDIPFVVGSGIPSNILIMETARQLDPDNVKILSALAEMYCSYGFGFVEEESKKKAEVLYRKGAIYAERALSLKNKNFQKTLSLVKEGKAQPEDLAKTITQKDIKDAFWYTSCLGYWIQASGGAPEAVAELSKMLALVDRLIEIDEGYFYGSPLILKATFYATAPSILGGSPVKAKFYFEKAFKKTDGKFALAKLVYAQFYATLLKDRTEKEIYEEEVERMKSKIEEYESILAEGQIDENIKDKMKKQINDLKEELKWIQSEDVKKLMSEKTGEQIFDETIEEILNIDSDVIPEIRLVTELAKDKAIRLNDKKAELF